MEEENASGQSSPLFYKTPCPVLSRPSRVHSGVYEQARASGLFGSGTIQGLLCSRQGRKTIHGMAVGKYGLVSAHMLTSTFYLFRPLTAHNFAGKASRSGRY